MARRLVLLGAAALLALAVLAPTALATVQSGTLTVQKAGNGYVSGQGIDCGATCTASYAYTDCDTSFTPPLCFPRDVTVTASDANGFRFDHWSGCDTTAGASCTTS